MASHIILGGNGVPDAGRPAGHYFVGGYGSQPPFFPSYNCVLRLRSPYAPDYQ